MSKQTVVVLKTWNGMALVDVVAAVFSFSKKRSKELLDQKAVMVNGRRVWIAKHVVRTGDTIEVVASASKPLQEKIKAAFEDEFFLIAEKPAGFVTNGTNSFEELLQQQYGNRKLRSVHRLDRDTSGLLIVSKNEDIFKKFVDLFKIGGVKKTYHAIVLGGSGMQRGKRVVIDAPLEGKSAYTSVIFLKANDAVSLAEIEIKTGRTHQIRKHLFSKGMQVLGDREYEIKKAAAGQYRSVPRQMLHARQLEFVHPITARKISCTAPYPNDFSKTLTQFSI